MAFGKPAKYWRLDPARWVPLEIKYDENICLFRAEGGASGWDSAVSEASEIYGKNLKSNKWLCSNDKTL